MHIDIISKNSGFKDAPPTKNPSIFGLEISSEAFFAVTDPPYYILTPFDISSEKFSAIQDLIYEWACSAYSEDAVLPVPIAHIGSYAITILDQSFIELLTEAN